MKFPFQGVGTSTEKPPKGKSQKPIPGQIGLRGMRGCKCVKGKSFQGMKKGPVHVQNSKQTFTNEIAISGCRHFHQKAPKRQIPNKPI